MNYSFRKRNLIEINFQKEDIEEDVINWCENNSNYKYNELSTLEYIFYLPQLTAINDYLTCFNPPDIIKEVFKQAIFENAGQDDPGFILIYFID